MSNATDRTNRRDTQGRLDQGSVFAAPLAGGRKLTPP
jgi:hypothetical protein